MFDRFIRFVQELYGTSDFIPLHEPRFIGNEKRYLNEAIDSSFVSSVGEFVNIFEQKIIDYTGAQYAVATINGTSALHISLMLAGVSAGDEVITQALTFVATANAIRYCDARPIFIDVEVDGLGMSPESLTAYLLENTVIRDEGCFNIKTGHYIRACVPMHTFGHPVRIHEIRSICDQYRISVVEDAAESLGSFSGGRHTGTFGLVGILSFNGNKIVTAGNGGMILTGDKNIAGLARHLTTTAKIPHRWEYDHDQVGYNYRLSNLNAAVACAQLEQLAFFLERKRWIAQQYQQFCETLGVEFVEEPKSSRSNYWLNAIILENREARDRFLEYTNQHGVMTRPIWRPMHQLPMFSGCEKTNLKNTIDLVERVVNIPSSVVL